MGKNSRLWSVVKATMVPAVMFVPPNPVPPFDRTHPATRYTRAGVIEKKIWITAKKDRPIICWRIWSPASRAFSLRNRSISKRCRPNTLDSRIPETDSVSSVMAVTSASVFCVLRATSCLAFPTL